MYDLLKGLFTNKDFLTHLSIWVLAVVTLYFLSTHSCSDNKMRVRHSDVYLVGTNVFMRVGDVSTNSYSEVMHICITNQTEDL